MLLKKWDDLPAKMKTPEVKKYYDELSKKKFSLVMKRFFDIILATILLILLSPIMLVMMILIKTGSKGPVFYRQERVTTYGKKFKIHKFRTMVVNADQIGSQVTVGRDPRITKVGHFLRQYRLDEFPQVIDVLQGTMTFVGTRPEVQLYVDAYTPAMMATLLLPAGITSEASIKYKDEAKLLADAADVDQVYIEKVLPGKMQYNLTALEEFSVWNDFKTMINTAIGVLK